jgi:menaquinone-dependent protoporphyrinogen oxidase
MKIEYNKNLIKLEMKSPKVIKMNEKVLVAYFTKGGASQEYAQVIADTLNDHGLSIDIHNLKDIIPDITKYDILILGTGVRMFMVYRRWKKILKQKAIKNKHLFMFLSSGMAIEEPEKAVEKFLQPLVKKYDLNPDSLVSFPGVTPEKWAKYDDGPKNTMKPELAKTWAEEIFHKIQ